jgi:hypothetical protein
MKYHPIDVFIGGLLCLTRLLNSLLAITDRRTEVHMSSRYSVDDTPGHWCVRHDLAKW